MTQSELADDIEQGLAQEPSNGVIYRGFTVEQWRTIILALRSTQPEATISGVNKPSSY